MTNKNLLGGEVVCEVCNCRCVKTARQWECAQCLRNELDEMLLRFGKERRTLKTTEYELHALAHGILDNAAQWRKSNGGEILDSIIDASPLVARAKEIAERGATLTDALQSQMRLLKCCGTCRDWKLAGAGAHAGLTCLLEDMELDTTNAEALARRISSTNNPQHTCQFWRAALEYTAQERQDNDET